MSSISTGKKENKFGVNNNQFRNILNNYKKSKYLDFACLSVHIGSQITSHKPYEKMLKVIQKNIDATKHYFEFIDLGGGMGIKYDNKDKILNYTKYKNLIKNF